MNDDAPVALSREYLLAHLRAGRARAQLAVCELDCIGVALKAGLIDTSQALAWADEVSALRFLLPPPADTEGPNDNPVPVPG